MSVRVISGASVVLQVGIPWVMDLEVNSGAYWLAAGVPVVTVTLPDASTAIPAVVAATQWPLSYFYGRYTVTYIPLVAGRFTARVVTAENGSADLLAVVQAAGSTLPDSDDLDDYLGGNTEHSWTTEDLDDALAAETLAQMRICHVPGNFPADLREALLRRAARNLAMRQQLTAEPRGEGDVELPAVLPVAADAEIRRLEKPFYRMTPA